MTITICIGTTLVDDISTVKELEKLAEVCVAAAAHLRANHVGTIKAKGKPIEITLDDEREGSDIDKVLERV